MPQEEFERLLNAMVIAGIAVASARDSNARRDAHEEFERLRHSVAAEYARATTAAPTAEPVFKPQPLSGTKPKGKRGKCADCGKGCGSFYRCANCHAKHKSKL